MASPHPDHPDSAEADGLRLSPNPEWYKDAVIYELHVRAFSDSDADGVGDFAGLTSKLDYLADLGVTALWLLPFYPSPLRDDGYDIADYYRIHPAYGTMEQFQTFLHEAHRRGLRVITELVMNHTSDQHPWFQRARRAEPGSPWRAFYVWSDTPAKYEDARIIFKDFEHSNWSWDPVAQAYYWHRFYSHQPDLNFDNPEVRQAMLEVVDYWFEMGVDGMRLDAVPYLYEREGTTCENLPETHEFLKTLRRHIAEKYPDRMLLAEANQWPEDAVAYFGDGDECHMNFHFPLMPRLFMAARMEDRFPIIDILDQTPPVPEGCQWAIFLRNHDELTLEMVTDEERDYMYRVYAREAEARINLGIRRRLAPLLNNNRRKIELMNGLLFSLPGTPVIYYGDEIGMGDNIYLGDRNGVRTPMQWSPDRNAGFSRANPQRLYLPIIVDPEYHYEAVNVEAQQDNPSSLLWWMKRLIAIRQQFRAFGRGSLRFLPSPNRKVLAFVREHEDERILVVANLSRFTQAAELDLSGYRGMVPVEIFGHTPFPPIGELPYFLTMGPHALYWFSLESETSEEGADGRGAAAETAELTLPRVTASGTWRAVFRGDARHRLETLLPSYLRRARWFGGKARRIKSTAIRDVLPLAHEATEAHLALVEVEYLDGDPDTYVLPLAFATGQRAEELLTYHRNAVAARLHVTREEGPVDGVLYDALRDPGCGSALLALMLERRRTEGAEGALIGTRLGPTETDDWGELRPTLVSAEQSNSSLIYGERYIAKLYRRLDAGPNPDLEISRVLTEQGFAHSPPLVGQLDYQRGRREPPMTMGLLQAYVPNEGDAWAYTLDTLDRFFERVVTQPAETTREAIPPAPAVPSEPLAPTAEPYPDDVYEQIGSYLGSAELLGRRTGQLHAALAEAGEAGRDGFEPQPLDRFARRSIYQGIRGLTRQTFQLLEASRARLTEALRPQAERVLNAEDALLSDLRSLLDESMDAQRIRTHGDYHLGQVLYTGKDFVIIDFEGEPARPLSERRLKRSPLRDVAGMLRSFDYAAHAALHNQQERGLIHAGDRGALEPWAQFWNRWVRKAFLTGYFGVEGLDALPASSRHRTMLLEAFLLEKAVYELAYELNNRPDWVRIPLRGIDELVDAASP